MKSPISGAPATSQQVGVAPDWKFIGFEANAELALLSVELDLIQDWTYPEPPYDVDTAKPICSEAVNEGLQALIRSYLWRAKRGLAKPNLILCWEKSYQRIQDAMIQGGVTQAHGYELRSIESLIRELDELTFEQKAMKTLENLNLRWHQNKGPIRLMSVQDQHSRNYFKYQESWPLEGMEFGFIKTEAFFVYEYLLEREFIKYQTNGWVMTANGIEKLDTLRRVASGKLAKVFFIRRCGEEFDKFLEPLRLALQVELGMDVETVWTKFHNEKIDERVFRMIRQSAAILVHVDDGNFNVGMEAGYAWALGKPLVAIAESKEDKKKKILDKMPFDLATLNCYFYKREVKTDPAKFQEAVELIAARIQIEFDPKPSVH